jgi:ABC-2 type transport system ATP-binding protein
MIKVEGLTKRYARNVAVDHISFEVEKGQIVGFLGPNGAGKTTTMRMLTCFLPPTEGSAEVAGFDIRGNPMEVKRRIGYLPESPPVYPEMEVIEYLDFVGRIKGVPKSSLKPRIDEVMQKCAITDVRTKEIGKLSKGYRQRVGLAQAILHNPDVLILDEPTAGLDPNQIKETRHLIKSLAGDHTIILSTHILPEVEQTCERVIIISNGKLKATDTVENLTSSVRGVELVELEVLPRDVAGGDWIPAVHQRLEQVPGVASVERQDPKEGRASFKVKSLQDRHIRPDLAKAIVEGGWRLNQLDASGFSLEEVFLQLTGEEAAEEASPAPEAAAEPETAAATESGDKA